MEVERRPAYVAFPPAPKISRPTSAGMRHGRATSREAPESHARRPAVVSSKRDSGPRCHSGTPCRNGSPVPSPPVSSPSAAAEATGLLNRDPEAVGIPERYAAPKAQYTASNGEGWGELAAVGGQRSDPPAGGRRGAHRRRAREGRPRHRLRRAASVRSRSDEEPGYRHPSEPSAFDHAGTLLSADRIVRSAGAGFRERQCVVWFRALSRILPPRTTVAAGRIHQDYMGTKTLDPHHGEIGEDRQMPVGGDDASTRCDTFSRSARTP